MLFMVYSAIGQTTKSIQLTYDSSDFTLETDSGLVYIGSSIHDLHFTSDTLSPALPHVIINILIEPTQSYVSHSLQQSTQLLASNVIIAPNTIEVIDTVLNDTGETYNISYSGLYPSSNLEYVGEAMIDGAKLLVFDYCPFKYYSSSHNLYLVSSLTINIMLNNDTPRNGENTGCLDNMYSAVSDIVVNPEDLTGQGSAYIKPIAPMSPAPLVTDGFEYIIVTTNFMKNEFQRLANWKTQKGIKATVITIEDINTQYSQYSSLELRIKYAIRNYYNGQYNRLKYVVLGGGHQYVPSPICYVNYLTHTTYTPTDWFYACFDTMDWDLNNNGRLGEVGDAVDLYPEVFVTRLPADNLSDAQIMVNKIINYESNPNTVTWHNRLLMGGNKLQKQKGNKSDAEYRGDKIYSNYIQPNWNGSMDKFYDTGTSFSGGANYQFTANNLSSVLSSGYPFVNIYTHGSWKGWNMETGNDFMSSAVNAVTNQTYSVITTNSCNTNSFDTKSNCLGCLFMKNVNAKCVGYWGSSRDNYSAAIYKKLSSANEFVGDFYKSLFLDSEKSFGYATTKARIANLGRCNHPFIYSTRYALFTFNALGDPEMPLYTHIPSLFVNVNISFVNNHITVNTGLSGCSICVMSKNDYGNQYYCVVRNASSYSFDISNSFATDYTVTISKPGYVTYTSDYTLPPLDNVYIQNQTFSNNTTITGNNIYVGKDVQMTQPVGEVEVVNGILTLQGYNIVHIKNGFSVNTGGQLIINNN